MPGRRFTNKNRNSTTDPSDKQRQRKTPYPPPPPVRNLTTEKNSLSTRKKPINDLSIIIIESKK